MSNQFFKEKMQVSDSNEDDDGSFRPGLESIMEAALLDDLGGSSVFLDRIVEFYRSWHSGRRHDRPMGRDQDLGAIEVAGQKTRPEVIMPTLSGISK
jgi:hypothetical protein